MELSTEDKEEIIRVYKGIDKSIFKYKSEVMNRMSEYFMEDIMRHVYTIILKYERDKTLSGE